MASTFRSTFLFLCVFTFVIQVLFVHCGIHIMQSSGKPPEPHQYPWILSLQKSRTSNHWKHDCGAALISVSENLSQSDIVITAAHCFSECRRPNMKDIPADKLRTYQIIAGQHFLNKTEGQQRLGLNRVKCNPNWNTGQNGYQHDIAIVRLNSAINFSEIVKAIRLPSLNQKIDDDHICTVAGWGKVNDNHHPIALQHATVKIKNEEECANEWQHSIEAKYDSKYMICAGRHENSSTNEQPSEHQKVVCLGDSGSPLMCDINGVPTIVGIVSFSCDSCSEHESEPDGYTKVAYYVDWVQEVIKELSTL